ncbi:MAG TPA: hypothetical protein VL294_03410 [Pseudolysinimonas sp.]|nr:hypothetical protein [Pseudolysinimonas sp.]
MADEKRVDPRYDPAFQRGFEGAVTSGLRRHPAQAPDAAIVTPAPYRAAPDREATRPDAAAASADEAHDPRRAVPESADGAEPDPDAVSPARRLSRNPFLVALVVLGLALTVGGLIWANQARLLVSGRGAAATDLDYWFLQATVTGAPLTIVAGVSILAGVLFVAATAWNRGR